VREGERKISKNNECDGDTKLVMRIQDLFRTIVYQFDTVPVINCLVSVFF
jgi:hypothetical protein